MLSGRLDRASERRSAAPGIRSSWGVCSTGENGDEEEGEDQKRWPRKKELSQQPPLPVLASSRFGFYFKASH